MTALCHAWNYIKLWLSYLKFWLKAPCCRRIYTFYFHGEWFENDAVVKFITSHMSIRWWSAIMFVHYTTASFIAHFFIFKPPRHSFHLSEWWYDLCYVVFNSWYKLFLQPIPCQLEHSLNHSLTHSYQWYCTKKHVILASGWEAVYGLNDSCTHNN